MKTYFTKYCSFFSVVVVVFFFVCSFLVVCWLLDFGGFFLTTYSYTVLLYESFLAMCFSRDNMQKKKC